MVICLIRETRLVVSDLCLLSLLLLIQGAQFNLGDYTEYVGIFTARDENNFVVFSYKLVLNTMNYWVTMHLFVIKLLYFVF